jgi:HK97 family phage major capsid protein
MPEIQFTELAEQMKSALKDEFATFKSERATADEARKKEIDAALAANSARVETLEKQLAAANKASIPGLEYGAKGEADKPTWTRLLQIVAEPERIHRKEYGPEKEMIEHVRKTAINAGTGSGGGFLVPTSLRQGIIPELRGRSIARKLGATVITGLSPGAHQWAKNKGGITATHLNTEGEESGTESVPTFDLITTTPRTAAIFVPMTRGMMTQTAEAIEPWVRGEVAKIMALFEDKQFFVGAGGSAPRGIFNHPSVQTFTFTETSISAVWQSLVEAVEDVISANADELDGIAWAMEPLARLWLGRILDLQARPLFQELMNSSLAGDVAARRLAGYPVQESTQLVNTAADRNVMLGPWSQGAIAEWSGLELILNTESDTNFMKARGTIRGLFDYDCAFFQPGAFTKASGFNSAAAVPTTL